ncbi:MAG TPA: hypothetical protein VHZ33_12220 [Trebonia sp.]|nr:hypothetical protein [Trebonia sp.]
MLAPLADGPAMFFGSTIMTFALPYGAFIAATIALYYLFRARHAGPRLRWSGGSAAEVTSVTTREPGPAPAPEVSIANAIAPESAAAPAIGSPETPVAASEVADDDPADDTPAGEDGEQE